MSAESKDRKIRILGLVVVVIALVGAYAGGRPVGEVAASGGEAKPVLMTENVTASGTANEGEAAAVPFKIVDAADAKYKIDKVTKVTFKLSWDDTAASGIAGLGFWYTNTPDELTLAVKPPVEGVEAKTDTGANAQGGKGEITIAFAADAGVYWDVRDMDWTVTIEANCGDEEPRGIGVLPAVSDTSTEWSMSIDYSFEVPEDAVGG